MIFGSSKKRRTLGRKLFIRKQLISRVRNFAIVPRGMMEKSIVVSHVCFKMSTIRVKSLDFLLVHRCPAIYSRKLQTSVPALFLF